VERQRYPTDLTDAKWTFIELLVPAVKAGGRPAKSTRREVLNGSFSRVRSDESGRLLPPDRPPWPTVWVAMSRLLLAGSPSRPSVRLVDCSDGLCCLMIGDLDGNPASAANGVPIRYGRNAYVRLSKARLYCIAAGRERTHVARSRLGQHRRLRQGSLAR
jgi:hypothetical protein